MSSVRLLLALVRSKCGGDSLRTAGSQCYLDGCSASGNRGLSDKAGREERRRANTGPSSEQIQFRSISIDLLLSPTDGLTVPSGHCYAEYAWQLHIPLRA